MNVNFYTDNPAKAPTVEHFLFSDNYALMMEGQNIEHNGEHFQANSLQWNDDTRKLLNVFVWKFPGSCNLKNLDTRDEETI